MRHHAIVGGLGACALATGCTPALAGASTNTLSAIRPALVQVCRGSGAYIAPDRILTAHHVVAAPDCILPYGKVVLADPENDVAVIETEQRSAAWLPIACKPAREALTASHRGSAASMHWVRGDEFEGRVYPGNSGSPIVNAKGEVFAVVSRGPGWSLDSHFQELAFGGMLKRTAICRSAKARPPLASLPSPAGR